MEYFVGKFVKKGKSPFWPLILIILNDHPYPCISFIFKNCPIKFFFLGGVGGDST